MASKSSKDVENSLPNRWLRCPRKGNLIGGLFIPLKTPLDEKYDEQIPEQYRFNLEMLFSSIKNMNQKMGMLIDLTFTKRFYNSEKVQDFNCNYFKIDCRGHGETPSEAQTQRFITTVEAFTINRPDEIIGVHCTHGFNRTGFLIVCYLIEKLDWDLEAAISLFMESRQPGIYKKDYINELYKRYDPDLPVPGPPALPDWYVEYDDNDREDDGVQKSSQKKNKNIKENPVFLEGVNIPNVNQIKDIYIVSSVQEIVAAKCQFGRKGFAGAQPVSLDRENISYLSKEQYRVSWKADGVRYLMYIKNAQEIYMLDRDNTVFKIDNLSFPRRKFENENISNTLVDGELVVDIHENKKIPRFLIYDIIMFEGQEVGNCDFDRRMLCIKKELIEPRQKGLQEGRISRDLEPFGIRCKEFHDISNTEKFYKDRFVNDMSHETDGLIFQPFGWKYVGGRTDKILKWKPPHLNSIDFLLKVVQERKIGCPPERIAYFYVGGLDVPFSSMKCPKDMRQYDGKIIECTWEILGTDGKGQWKFLRERKDKSFPNSYDTAKAVANSIRYPVTKDILLEFIKTHGWKNPKLKKNSSEMPPPAKVPRIEKK